MGSTCMQGLTVRWTCLGETQASGFEKPTALWLGLPCDKCEAREAEVPQLPV
jgi:hypothetical protein